jgi:hypothetical protein
VQPDSQARLGRRKGSWDSDGSLPRMMAELGLRRQPAAHDGGVGTPTAACRAADGTRRERRNAQQQLILDGRTDGCVSACRCILDAWDGICPWSVIQIRRPDKRYLSYLSRTATEATAAGPSSGRRRRTSKGGDGLDGAAAATEQVATPRLQRHIHCVSQSVGLMGNRIDEWKL